MLRPVEIMIVNGIYSVFLASVVLVTFGPIWPWFRTEREWTTARILSTPVQEPISHDKKDTGKLFPD